MKTFTYDTIVIGSGAAGYNALCRLREGGRRVAMVCENRLHGTSRNTGSDKQTYYKLGLGGDVNDSVRLMAEDLFCAGSVDGDNALCEAALSTRCFMNLVELGVPFPTNRYGEYVGYKTDHDPYARATSAGPLTSKFMTEALEKRANTLGCEIFSGYYVTDILTDADGVTGVLSIDESGEYTAFSCGEVILATGGPAGVYTDSVYPESQYGSSSLALRAGASLQNLTEWQYGLASVLPRWNVSGTYMQVLPRLVSVDCEGNEYEFLLENFENTSLALSMLFLKGYQWPFDFAKLDRGSSYIDFLVWQERFVRGRRVFLDYTKNPEGLDFSQLSGEAFEYLDRAGAVFGTPVERLRHMNEPAYELYLSKGVDLESEMLEISLSAQHCNGGVAVDSWWQTSVKGLFAVGECAGTHGVTRPGGSALNSGQVGSLRASQYILNNPRKISESDFEISLNKALKSRECPSGECDIYKYRKEMSSCAAAIRDVDGMQSLLDELERVPRLANPRDDDTVIMQRAMLCAMLDFYRRVKANRGSAVYRDGGDFCKTADRNGGYIQEISLADNGFVIKWRGVRPIPEVDDVFESVWKDFREGKAFV